MYLIIIGKGYYFVYTSTTTDGNLYNCSKNEVGKTICQSKKTRGYYKAYDTKTRTDKIIQCNGNKCNTLNTENLNKKTCNHSGDILYINNVFSVCINEIKRETFSSTKNKYYLIDNNMYNIFGTTENGSYSLIKITSVEIIVDNETIQSIYINYINFKYTSLTYILTKIVYIYLFIIF